MRKFFNTVFRLYATSIAVLMVLALVVIVEINPEKFKNDIRQLEINQVSHFIDQKLISQIITKYANADLKRYEKLVAIANELHKIDFVNKYYLFKTYSGTLKLKLVEFERTMLIKDGSEFFWVNEFGDIIPVPVDNSDELFFVDSKSNKETRDFVEFISQDQWVVDNLYSITQIEDRRFDLVFNPNRIKIKLPEFASNQTISRIIQFLKDDNVITKDIVVVDCRDKKRIIIQTKKSLR
ncbi:MAG: cell division protein FtsQ/DivIB [Alphaproteobacteria bacterium]|nr:cell division protein FtsQ/DivIB [Alphaproteobacteria bacterium]MBL0718018.1 cell division protein FtsQ/DivIB [Alphaproteobacteria bacterium]